MFNNMDRRTHESPMDWEWQTQGPTDPKTPFPQWKPQPGHKASFESPPKPATSFMKNSTPAPAFRNPSFTTPRKPFDQDLLSEVSGAESSPADNGDIDTPEAKGGKNMTAFTGASERKPIFGRYGLDFTGSSPGRGDLRRGKYANAIVNKVRKRKRLERDYALVGVRRGSESESDDEDTRPRSRHRSTKSNAPGWFGSILSGIESRPQLPDILSYWAQLALNVFLIGILIYAIVSFYLTIRLDVEKAAQEEVASVMAEIEVCTRDYLENRCGPDLRLPAMKAVCENWEACMNKDPKQVGRARVSAHTFAQIFNSFIEPISWKAMIFSSVLVVACFSVNNMVFGSFRSGAAQAHHAPQYFHPPPQAQPSQYQWGPVPQTPSSRNVFSAPYESDTPWLTGAGQRSPSKGSRSPSKGNRSPSKGDRDRYRLE
ncbi:nuclear envelope protein [Phlyctema vagabunda]|uniref:Nuclear envelope protein n=1 Tax=Phlyctema vagabunda TaxID=108571 RepID=A0ABR4P1H6_9HELO